jgi:hypothetical protein
MLLRLASTLTDSRGPQYMEQALAAIHQANPSRRPLTLIFASRDSTSALFFRVPPELAHTAPGQLAAAYPDCKIDRLPEDALHYPPGDALWQARLTLRPDLYAIRRYGQFTDQLNRNVADPLTALLSTVASSKQSLPRTTIEITVYPASRGRYWQSRWAVQCLASPLLRSSFIATHLYARAVTSRFAPLRSLALGLALLLPNPKAAASSERLTTSPDRDHDREEDFQGALDKLGQHLFEVSIRLSVSGPPKAESRARAKLQEMAGAFGQFTMPRLSTFRMSRIRRKRIPPRPSGRTSRPRGFLLSSEELATLWHPPTETVRAPAMRFNESRELEAPLSLPSRNEKGVAILGRVRFRARREVFGIRQDDRRRHLAVIAKAGMGKTTLLENLIASDIEAGRGVALIDPHGDLAESVLESVSPNRTNDVVLFDAGDRGYPLAFNPLSCKRVEDRPLVASGIVSAFHKLYGDSWGPRLEHILRNSLLALLEIPGTSLLSLQRLLSDAQYRKTLTCRLADPVVRAFWETEFARWKPNFQAEAVAPIQNKVGQFLSQPILRAIIGQSRSRLNLRQVMDEGRILIVNLSKGRLGEDASTLLGALLVTSMQLAAMSRAEVPEEDRLDFSLYVDEFQNFATESFATILSEARKYRLHLIIANQYLAQMEEQTAGAVFGNVGSLLCFQVGARDAEILAEQLGGDVTPQDLIALPRFTAYLRLLLDGMPSRAFSMETLPPRRRRPADRNRPAIIRRTSRRRYARPAREVVVEIEHVFAVA